MDNRIYELHKRIMKHDVQAIDDIKTLEEAKEVIRMIVGNQLLHIVPIVHATHAATTAEEIMDKMTKLRKFLIENNYKGKQTFDTRNIVGDSMYTVYDNDGITVDYCYYYDYLEIFGLTEEEYTSLKDILDVE